MVYTTNSTIDIHYVLEAGSEDTTATTATVHSQVLFEGTTATYTSGVSISQPSEIEDGYIKMNVPVEIGNNTVKLLVASNDSLETDGTTTELLGVVPVKRIVDATEALI